MWIMKNSIFEGRLLGIMCYTLYYKSVFFLTSLKIYITAIPVNANKMYIITCEIISKFKN